MSGFFEGEGNGMLQGTHLLKLLLKELVPGDSKHTSHAHGRIMRVTVLALFARIRGAS